MAGEPPAVGRAACPPLAGPAAPKRDICIMLAALVVLAVPLAIDPFGLRPFVPAKQAVLLVGAALVALAACLRFSWRAWHAIALPRPVDPTSFEAQAVAPSQAGAWLAIAALAFGSWSLLVVAPLAINPALHLGFGVTRLSACLVMFFAAMSCAQRARRSGSPQPFGWLLGAVAVATLAMACHAGLQAAHADPLEWIVGRPAKESGRWRIFATAGNPAWTAEFLAAGAPLAVWWASRFTRAAPLLWLLFAAAILPTGSRLGLAALLLGAAVHAWARRRAGVASPVSWKRAWAVSCSTIALITLAWLWRDHGFAETLLRVDDLDSIAGRLRLWQASLQLIASRPLAGHGLDHFALVLPDGLRAVVAPLDPVARSRMPAMLVDHAHNDLLEAGVETGVPGMLSLLALIAAGMRAAWRALGALRAPADDRPCATPADSRNPVVPALLASLAVLGMLSLGSAPLHTPSTALLFWLVLGCLAGLGCHDAPRRLRALPSGWRIGGALVAVCTMLVATAWAGHRAWTLATENRQVAAAAGMALAGNRHAAKAFYAAALRDAPWDHESGVALASLLLDENRPDAALRVLDGADAWSQSREAWLLRAQALVRVGDPRGALQVANRATAAVPDFLRAQMLKAELATRLGRNRQAEAALQQVLLSPQDSSRARQIRFEAAEALPGPPPVGP